jgi:uncharacterized protein (TIGR02611 family)
MGNDLYMIEQIKQHWSEFKQSKPGHRFQDRYRRRQRAERGHIVKRIFLIVLGAVIAVGSLILAPLPGPGWATVFIGLMILAGELLPAARSLDWLEVRIRVLGRFTLRVWKSSVLGKAAVVVVVATLAAAVLYVAYLLLFSGSLF